MKKIIILFLTILLCGCKSKYTICKIDISNNDLNYKMEAEYRIYYKNSFVTKIEKIEDYYIQDNDIDNIKYLYESKKVELDSLQTMYNGYIYIVNRDKNHISAKIDIDISQIDIEKMLDDEYIDKNYVNNNKITVGGIKLFYESKGAKCEN